jgi:hypothetical protein
MHSNVDVGLRVRGTRNGCCGLSREVMNASSGEGVVNSRRNVVRGRKSAVKAKRVVWTPTIDVYREKGKKPAFSGEADTDVAVFWLEAFGVFDFFAMIVEDHELLTILSKYYVMAPRTMIFDRQSPIFEN